ncbi:MAG TPA: hypothetical protein VFQ91_06725 [Bryobacteraceae bacterium]|nr:hypothetical protein [Bryobacteraceae bacterium]
MTPAVARQRCWTHAQREAAGRCPECRRFYCRECVTEHAGRLLCVQCLSTRTEKRESAQGTRWAAWIAAAAVGLLMAFVLFYSAGYLLQQIPSSWSAGTDRE